MSSLSRDHRKLLENTVAQARQIAVEGARKVLKDQYAVESREPWEHMKGADGDSPEEHATKKLARELRSQLRAHAQQLGDKRDPRSETQEIRHLVEACAYEHWHRMLFARFLAENDLLLDSEHGVPMTIEEVQELAREQRRDWMEIATELAQRMLLAVFRPDDPVLKVQLPPETQQQLEEKLAALPREIFLADDSLGWVYQFWQRDEKDRVNKSEVKIGADELPAVTQLFTEDYMVLFLLENTLGAWWIAKRRAEGKEPVLPGYQWTYLRLNEDGSPATGTFDGWPRAAKKLKVLDPCMGSGHFLVFALPILARMRMEEEKLSLQEALFAVLSENLFGLEIDARCSQIAAFNLALAAWRLAGGHFTLPEVQLACSGLAPNCTREQWMKLAEEVAASGGMPAKTNLFESEDSLLSEPARNAMEGLYELFSQAPTLGSLIDPANRRRHLLEANYQAVAGLFEGVLRAQSADENTRERLIAAAGMVRAGSLLASKYTLVATNVPYLGRGKQSPVLAQYCADHYADAKVDLATCFLERCLRFADAGCSVASVTPQNWLFLMSYKRLRERLLKGEQWDFVAHLGEHALDSSAAAGAFVALLCLSRVSVLADHEFAGWDLSQITNRQRKTAELREGSWETVVQSSQVVNPDARVSLQNSGDSVRLSRYANSFLGLGTGDYAHYGRRYWEFPAAAKGWTFQQTSVESTILWGGREHMLSWDEVDQRVLGMSEADKEQIHNQDQSGQQAWGRKGIAVTLARELRATLYSGEKFDKAVAVLVPLEEDIIPALWSFCSAGDFDRLVRKLDQKIIAANATLVKIPFDLVHWQSIAAQRYPNGLPKPHSDDPTQWLFNGHPKGSDYPLQVAVARLLGYRWPRQTGSSFPDCSALGRDGLEKHIRFDGILPLNEVAFESSAADRLRALMADAYGAEWSAAKLHECLGQWDSLDDWLRDGFFEEHCTIFCQCPFVWHVWDGRKDGFHALVNYHKLAAPKGEGRQTLEKLIYTWLGRWIDRQNDEVRAGKEGADARLAAARHLKSELEKILVGEKPYDVFVRWKPLAEQPIGWEPDVNDGVRLNIRPWLTTTLAPSTKPKKDACILRVTPKIKYGRDRGTEPCRKKGDFPWFWSWDPAKVDRNQDFLGNNDFDGARWNDLHYSLTTKQHARARKASQEDHKELAATAGGETTTK